jgi:hypothetical protein
VKTLISASRRTDLVAFFPDWLSAVLRAGRARVLGPSRRALDVDLSPVAVHTVVLWSKDFSNLIRDAHGLRGALAAYGQLYVHFTVTGLGGSVLEPGAPAPEEGLGQLDALVRIAGRPERVSLRVDPIVHWREAEAIRTNLAFFERAVRRAAAAGVRDIRTSFAQPYPKALARFKRAGLAWFDPPLERKREAAAWMAERTASLGLRLFICSQRVLTDIPGLAASACVDGRRLRELHPAGEPASLRKDRSQRPDCGCTESVDIGSYTQSCPHSCLYCYANPRR